MCVGSGKGVCLTVSRPLYAKVGVNIYHQQRTICGYIGTFIRWPFVYSHQHWWRVWHVTSSVVTVFLISVMKMGSQSDPIEVNVVSSPESSSRNTPSPEPAADNFTRNITCFPVIKTTDGDRPETKDTPNKNTNTTQKSSGGSTNFSISSILSRSEPTAKKNGFLGVQTAHQAGVLESGLTGNAENSMLSR